ncbi:MAG TPA: A/G-specific adenine glycosylase [Candidatus Pelagibacter sp.]|nr:A/G-specific adenine glycosylase [Candidatus Pelagibacter sp.]
MHINNNLSKKILIWYDNNQRTLPWRIIKNSKKKQYYRLLSEFMLQQTQVKTVIPYFHSFVKKIPNLKALSNSNEKTVLKLWEGLGYYNRAKNLHKTSKILIKKYKGQIPESFVKLIKLPGIGDYTANILLALIYNQPRVALDGNVKRVLSRLFNITTIDKVNLFRTKRNGDLAEALMEFGALICKPKDPRCYECKIKKMCAYFTSESKITFRKKIKIHSKSYDIFCYLKKNKKQIALTKNNDLGFLKNFNLPKIKETSKKNKNWKFLCNYKNSISNKKLNINLYYKFSSKIPTEYNWYSLNKNNEFIPSFTKKIFKQISHLY